MKFISKYGASLYNYGAKKLGRFFIIKYFFTAKPSFTPTPVSNAWAQHCLYPLYERSIYKP